MEAPDEEQQVRQWIMKKRFDAETADRQERDRLIRFLLRTRIWDGSDSEGSAWQ